MSHRGTDLKVSGEPENVIKAAKTIESLVKMLNRGEMINEQSIRYVITLVNEGNESKVDELSRDCICITSRGKPVKPKTSGAKGIC